MRIGEIALDTTAKNHDDSLPIYKTTKLRNKTMPQSIQVSVSVLVLLLCMIGCHTPLSVKQMQAKNPLAKNAPKTPVKVVDAWNSYAQATPDGKIMRGMAGRVHFYGNQKEDQAVKVDGDLTVYVFDGKDTDPTHTMPLKIFQFKAETLAQHYSQQKPFGHGYDFFLPMDEIGGDEQSLSIVVRFDNRLDDMFVLTQPTNTTLAGRKPQHPVEPTIREFLDSRSLLAETNRSIVAEHDASVIQQASYIAEKQEAEQERSKVSTIPLTGDMTRRLYSTTMAKEEDEKRDGQEQPYSSLLYPNVSNSSERR